jgi:PAS domain S-box-containing protein
MIPRSEPVFGTPWRLIAIFLFLVVGIAVTADIYYEFQKAAVKKERNDDLNDIANLKVNEIAWWVRERLADANGIFRNTLIINDLQRWMTKRSDASLESSIVDWMNSLKTDYDYRNVFLFDGTGSVRLALPKGESVVENYAQELISEALQTRRVVVSDLYPGSNGKNVHMDIVIPLFAGRGQHGPPVGGLLLCIDPSRILFPLIKAWPTPSKTAETLLIRREGSEVVFLNELRHRRDAPLSFRLPVSIETLPAAMAARGKDGIVEGIDYRGVPVIAAIRKVPDSSWVLIAKVDQEEIDAPIRERYWTMIFIVVVLIAGAGGGAGLVWRSQRAVHYRTLYETETLYRTIFENTGTATFMVGEDTVITLVNSEFEKLSGYSREELEGRKSWTEFIAPEDLERLKSFFYSDMADPSYPQRNFEFRFVDRNGTLKEIFASVAVIPAVKKGLASFLDITTRKHAEAALRTAHDDLETVVDQRTEELRKSNESLTREIAEHMRTEEALKASQTELRYLSSRIISAQETERKRIARELHDQLGQDLTLMKLNLRAVQRRVPAGEGELREGCEEILQFIDRVVENVRRLSRNLSPVALDEFGLAAAIRGLVATAEKTYDIRIAIDIEPVDDLFSKEVQIRIYRILQEALTNIGKHASARNAAIVARKSGHVISFTIEDDGAGFDMAKSVMKGPGDKGLGLTIMKERVQIMRGTFDVRSRVGEGTKIAFTIPIEEKGQEG